MASTNIYQPSAEILDKYAQVLVHFALGKDEGIAEGEVVQCMVPDVAKPLALALQNTILKAGGHVLMRILPTGFDRDYYTLASQEQLTFFPEAHLRTRADLINHSIGIIADPFPDELSSVDPESIMLARNTQKPYRDWLVEKELNGNYTWTLALWGVPAKAKIVGLSLEEYWQQIIKACFLDMDDPIGEWRKIKKLQQKFRDKLNALSIEKVSMIGPDIDLEIALGANRQWKGGADRNIPSFELFTSPDWRGTNGHIRFNQPLFRYGNVLDGIELEFKDGLITKAHAEKGNSLLQTMIKSPNANKLGEFSLTDSRLSRINHFMAETLYDENIGGPQGNTHVAIGMAYRDCLRGEKAKLTAADWEALGFNDSPEHTDIISTERRTVTATLTDGTQKVIYSDGKFVI
ncbi:aminopeptidase [Candidatus Woesebacteria bacterium]|nr:aminopeptidase [Candidatus Woesebacteria bacterium]